MNSKVENLLKEIKLELIKDTDYTKYKELEDKIKQNPKLYSKIKEFKRLKIYNAVDYIHHNPIDVNSKVNVLYAEIFFDDLGREYLILEKKIIDKANKIIEEVYACYEFDLNFIVNE